MNDSKMCDKGSRQIVRAEWARHVSDYKASGMSKVDFCRARGLVVRKLYYWLKALQKDDNFSFDLIEVAPCSVSPGSGVWILCGRYRVCVDERFDSRVLRRVVEALS